MLLAASFDATTSVWENVNGAFSPVAALEGHEHEVKAAVFDSSGVYVATCSRDKSVWIWEMDQGEFECVSVLHGHSQDVKSVLWHPTEVIVLKAFVLCVCCNVGFFVKKKALLVSCSYDDTIKIWAEGDDDWYCRQTLQGHESTVWDISFDRSGNRLASASDDRDVRIWGREGNEWRCSAVISGVHQRAVYSVAFSCVGEEFLATAGADNHVRVLSSRSPFVVLADSGSLGGDVNCARWNPKEQNILASCGDDKMVRIWKFNP
jgi:WD40 repeat protein